jgi:hypothetical protein
LEDIGNLLIREVLSDHLRDEVVSVLSWLREGSQRQLPSCN